ncbi:MAG: hypothetical protein ONB05_02395 [candidate division KSB1 bacterium]|nr:hypothetical protein [candidate division KSB1 bacterium]
MSLDKTVLREALAHYRAWNEAKFVEAVLTAGQKTPAEKWQEYQDLFAFGRLLKPEPSLWEQKWRAEEWATYYERIRRFEEWRRQRGTTT